MHTAEPLGVSMPSGNPVRLRELRVIFVIGFIVLLTITMLAKLLALKWRPWPSDLDGKRSMIARVRSSVYDFLSYIP